VVFDKGDLVPAIRASISVPGLFRPYEYNNRLLIDGGVVNPVPFDLLTNDCDFIICVDVSGEKDIKAGAIPGPVDVLLGTFQIMQKVIIAQKEKDRLVKIYCKPRLQGIRAFEILQIPGGVRILCRRRRVVTGLELEKGTDSEDVFRHHRGTRKVKFHEKVYHYYLN
jgi:predicted acylesterase/phospholipase RssA